MAESKSFFFCAETAWLFCGGAVFSAIERRAMVDLQEPIGAVRPTGDVERALYF